MCIAKKLRYVDWDVEVGRRFFLFSGVRLCLLVLGGRCHRMKVCCVFVSLLAG